MQPTNPNGNCFIIALQMIHDYSTTDDPLPQILKDHNIDPSSLDFSKLFLVHGTGIINFKRKNHAWIELDGYAIDYSNGNRVVSPKDIYYDPLGNDLTPTIVLEREQVLQLLLNDPHLSQGYYWGDYTKDDLDRIRQAYNASTYQDWNRNFLQELEDNQRLYQK